MENNEYNEAERTNDFQQQAERFSKEMSGGNATPPEDESNEYNEDAVTEEITGQTEAPAESASEAEASPNTGYAENGNQTDSQNVQYTQGYQQPYNQNTQYTQGYQQPYNQNTQYAHGYQQPYNQNTQYAQGYQQPYNQNAQYARGYQQPYNQRYYRAQPLAYPQAPTVEPPQTEEIVSGKKRMGSFRFSLLMIAIIVGVLAITLVIGLIIGAISDSGEFGAVPQESPDVFIEIPLADRPQLDSEYYQEEDGRYTTIGVAKALYPSIYTVFVYESADDDEASSIGSAIVISEDGYLVTNCHVAGGAVKVEVKDCEDNYFKATVVGSDEKTDVCVLKINETGLVPAVLGDSDQTILGEQVMAIGTTMDVVTTSFGWVTGLDREFRITDRSAVVSNIQTDAACNSGNSGGALVNMYGQVIGMITWGRADYTLVNFAIATNDLKPVIESIIENGYVKGRTRVGITYTGVDIDVAKKIGLDYGITVMEIDESCDIYTTELEVGDIITEINDTKIYSTLDITEALEGMKPGDIATSHVYRIRRNGTVEEFDISFRMEENKGE